MSAADKDLDLRLVECLEAIAQNGRDANRIAGMITAPVLSERDKVRADVWLKVYCASLNCVGVNTNDAKNCADKGLKLFEEKFLNSNF